MLAGTRATRYCSIFWLPLGRTAREVISSTCWAPPDGLPTNFDRFADVIERCIVHQPVGVDVDVDCFFRDGVDAHPLVKRPLHSATVEIELVEGEGFGGAAPNSVLNSRSGYVEAGSRVPRPRHPLD